MVAPYLEPRLSRSLVRIPNNSTTTNRVQHTVLADLSRVSALAAMVPVPRVPCCHHTRLPATSNMDRAELKPQVSPVPPSPAAAAPRSTSIPQTATIPMLTHARMQSTNNNVVSATRKHPRPEDSTEAVATSGDFPPTKRQRVGQEYPPTAAYAEMPQRTTFVPAAVAHGSNSSEPSASGGVIVVPVYAVPLDRVPAVLTTCSSQQVLQERNRLKQENLDLKQKLFLFQQLFRNKERLISVVRSLGLNIQQ
nr:uncharacterized protein LOC123771927 [Procambarus clarkii]